MLASLPLFSADAVSVQRYFINGERLRLELELSYEQAWQGFLFGFQHEARK